MSGSALRLFGVVLKNGLSADATRALPGVELVTVRDLAAAVEPAGAGTVATVSRTDVDYARAVVQALFERDPVLPAPVGATFKSHDHLRRWMELHYVVLSEALGWVERRVAGRVHVRRVDGDADGPAPATVLAALTRQLESRIVATVSLHSDASGASAAALVERDRWQGFVAAVSQAGMNHFHVRVTTTGPWPPYDFVRLQLSS